VQFSKQQPSLRALKAKCLRLFTSTVCSESLSPLLQSKGGKKKKNKKKKEKKRKNSQHYLPLSAKEHNIDLPFPTAIVCPFAK